MCAGHKSSARRCAVTMGSGAAPSLAGSGGPPHFARGGPRLVPRGPCRAPRRRRRRLPPLLSGRLGEGGGMVAGGGGEALVMLAAVGRGAASPASPKFCARSTQVLPVAVGGVSLKGRGPPGPGIGLRAANVISKGVIPTGQLFPPSAVRQPPTRLGCCENGCPDTGACSALGANISPG